MVVAGTPPRPRTVWGGDRKMGAPLSLRSPGVDAHRKVAPGEQAPTLKLSQMTKLPIVIHQ